MSIVRQLQQDALDPQVSVTQLLRKAVLIAQKLNLSDTEKWLMYERSGYPAEVEPPDYRLINVSSIEAYNPYRGGWVRVASSAPEVEEVLAKQKIYQPLASIESAITEGEGIYFSLPGMHSSHGTDIRFSVSSISLGNTVNAVRDAILDWAVMLEGRNILGEELSFSDQEVKTAQAMPQQPTQISGTFLNAQFQISSPHSQQHLTTNGNDIADLSRFVEALASSSAGSRLDDEVREELEAEIATLRAQIRSPKPKAGVIVEALKSVRTVAEGAAGGVLAGSISPTLTELISRFGG
jgi:hypothetical protein